MHWILVRDTSAQGTETCIAMVLAYLRPYAYLVRALRCCVNASLQKGKIAEPRVILRLARRGLVRVRVHHSITTSTPLTYLYL